MSLFSIVGDLGAGKTLTLTFLTWKNWFFRREKLYSNYHLYTLPYYYVTSPQQFSEFHDGWFSGDEIWLYLDSRFSRSKKNTAIANILSKSRKRDLTYAMTCQVSSSLESRVRRVLDFTFLPQLSMEEDFCKVLAFKGGFPKPEGYIRVFYYKTPLVFNMYNTKEEIEMDDIDRPLGLPIFQESPNTKPKTFKTWEQADEYAETFWREEILRKNKIEDLI